MAVLDGIRVIDFGRYVAGPYCATLLGYLGADVIRVERPDGGEDRFIAPLPPSEVGSVFLQTACNKRSLTLNLREPDAADIIDRLLGSADVVVANLPGPALQRMGLDWERVKAINPRLVLATQTAFGQDGPWADRGGFDGIGQAMSGAMFMTGEPDQPAKAAAPYVDYTTAVLSAFGVMAALFERERTGLGQQVEASLLGTALSVFNSHLVEQGVLGIHRTPSGNRVQTSSPSDRFQTQDGFILTHVVGKGLFRRCAQLIGREDWLTDPDLETDQQRGDRRDALCSAMAAWCADRTSEQALEQLREAGVPAGPVLDLQQALDHPQTRALGALASVEFPDLPRPAPVADIPVRLSDSAGGIQRRPPKLGEHSAEILSELGFTDPEIADLRTRGVI